MDETLTADEAEELEILKKRSTLGKIAVPVDPRLFDPKQTEALRRILAKGHMKQIDCCPLPHIGRAEPRLRGALFDVYQTTRMGEAWAVAHGAPRPTE